MLVGETSQLVPTLYVALTVFVVYQCGELEAIPKKMEADREDMKKKLEKLEGEKEVEDGKMTDVMENLKTETKVGIKWRRILNEGLATEVL